MHWPGPGSVMIARLIRDADAGFASGVSFSIRALLPGIQLIAATADCHRGRAGIASPRHRESGEAP